MLRWLRRKAVGFLLNSLELEEKPAHSGISCEDSHSLLCWSPRTECAFRQGSLGDVSPKTRTLSPFTHRNAQSPDLTASQRLAEKAPQTKRVDSRAVPWQAWGFRTIVNMLHGYNFSESGYIDYQDVTGSPLLIRYG